VLLLLSLLRLLLLRLLLLMSTQGYDDVDIIMQQTTQQWQCCLKSPDSLQIHQHQHSSRCCSSELSTPLLQQQTFNAAACMFRSCRADAP
jgi:hypothetical protein